MKFKLLFSFFSLILFKLAAAQNVQSSAQILNKIQQLEVTGTVLYIAAHPDDENTRLLSYLSNEKKYRTAYLSLTRGDGGQNLIGDEQGVLMGLIRTQELIAARKVDGAEQFFTRAYDFGYSKRPDETLEIWDKDAVLADVVWAIRSIRPEVIICRFPSTGEGGHGHHTASALLAAEAFDAAADPNRYPEQLKYVDVWQPTRLLWNQFSFDGMSNNLHKDTSLFKIDCGGYNALLGMSYGEMSAYSRSKHSSQGFGVAAQRGTTYEYFSTIKGTAPRTDLMDGVQLKNKMQFKNAEDAKKYDQLLQAIIKNFDPLNPHASVSELQKLEDILDKASNQTYRKYKMKQLQETILAASGIFMEVTSSQQALVAGDSVSLTYSMINRTGLQLKNVTANIAEWNMQQLKISFDDPQTNVTQFKKQSILLPENAKISQPYWLEKSPNGIFYVEDQLKRNLPEIRYPLVNFKFDLNNKTYILQQPVQFKYTEPTKGEIYQPAYVTLPASVSLEPSRFIINSENKTLNLQVDITFNKAFSDVLRIYLVSGSNEKLIGEPAITAAKGEKVEQSFSLIDVDDSKALYVKLESKSWNDIEVKADMFKISYSHIPEIIYHVPDSIQMLKMDIKTASMHIGYIPGAGDKMAEALVDMGYNVTVLDKSSVLSGDLQKFDAIVTGIRAYNMHTWLDEAYPKLMQYISNGGILLVQYNTNNRLAAMKLRMAPYPFSITRNRVTNEQANVKWKDHKLFNYPNKITAADFDGWVQERSVYHAGDLDKNYTDLLMMNDPGENNLPGSLIITDYGKGRFIYTGLSLFRQLPAGVTGAYRLLANLLSK